MNNLFISINTGVIVECTATINSYNFKGVVIGIDYSKIYDYAVASYYKVGYISSNWSPSSFIPYYFSLNKLKIL